MLVLLLAIAAVCSHVSLRRMARANLAQVDGTATLPGLSGPVTVQYDRQGVPRIHAQSLDDLVLAQAWVTTHERLWQMDVLRRHAAGELAEVLGPSLLPHDRMQRTLQLRAAADRALATMPPAELHLLSVYAQGVNAAMADQKDHLPIEFRVLRYTPKPWTPRDSLLVQLSLFEDLTNNYRQKLDREQLTAALAPELVADLFPVGSWRDHPPTQPPVDLTIEGPQIEDVPLDESQSQLRLPQQETPAGIEAEVAALIAPKSPDSIPGSNNWVVAGSRTASAKPILANDMHLSFSMPGVWYEADLEAPLASGQPGAEPLHVAGVTLPGIPLVVVGHNAHIAWGFTNLGADVQDLYIEKTRNNGTEFQAADGSWQPVLRLDETIAVHNGKPEHFVVTATRHGDAITPILTPVLPPTLGGGRETRTIALRWTIYDPSVIRVPTLEIDSAHDWASFTAAIALFGGPSQNIVYADDQGHIGYHATGRIPLRGPASPAAAAPLPIPTDIAAGAVNPLTQNASEIRGNAHQLGSDAGLKTPERKMLSGPIADVPQPVDPAREWSGYIPFDQLPQIFDPPGGILATANARITPDDYPYPVADNWGASYRTERIWKLLASRHNLTPADMLAIQNDIYSDFDHVLAQRIAYAVDHSAAVQKAAPGSQAALRQAADILRTWNGNVETTSVAANIVAATKAALWPLLLDAKIKPVLSAQLNKRPSPSVLDVLNLYGSKTQPASPGPAAFYNWYERDYALEQLVMHTPQRWLPQHIASWDDLLATALDKGLADAHAPASAGGLAKWTYGKTHVVDITHPIFGQPAVQARILARLLGLRTGTGSHPLAGDGTTVKQVTRTLGPSMRLTADLGDPDKSTLNVVTGQSGNPASPHYLDQFQAWYRGTTFAFPFTDQAAASGVAHTLTLTGAK